ncbi:DEAD/DEAH box helicase family protein [Cetobacterium somerae]|uniref:DEAD/DEAH box helicase family protein n=1 Tax=Cetobacterium sp. NK01 TaxID=2993530 RepID=UPI002116338B|nr:DEAD/DEAH box helicase family protein [Cetobacterium sp. NK01]MCQ8213256.1 DEAD/DEAH box helicase family protein [Cetobacterium sp. NK01]
MSNFSFLENDFKELYLDCKEAEENVYIKPRTSCFYSRRALELAVNILFDLEGLDKPTKEINGKIITDKTLGTLIRTSEFKSIIDNSEELEKINIIRLSGNEAVHKNSAITSEVALISLEILYDFTSWMAYCYGSLKEEKPFNINIINKYSSMREEELLKRIEILEKEKNENLNKLNYSKVEQVNKKHRELTIKNIDEAKTRKLYIDILLREAGWDINQPNVKEFKVNGMPNKKEEGYADYVLWGDNGKPLAVVEAKRTLKNPEEGKHQVTLYAECLEKDWGQYPVRFYTNGFETYIWEKNEIPRQVYGFYRKEELETLIIRRTQSLDLDKARKLINPDIAGRSYQLRAITKVIENYYDNYRKALLVMATGSGKTRTSISIVDVLLTANRIKRVLFLADRTALVNQAQKNFSKLIGSDHTLENLIETKGNSKARIVFSTYQTMINEIDKLREDGTRQFGVGYFDLIIVDESHRSIYKKYGAIFDYFDSLLLGLTATPKDEIDRNTYKVFDLKDGEPTDSYNLFDAVNDGYLVLPEVKEIDLKFPEKGIKYSELSDADKEEYELKFSDDEGNIPDEIGSEALNSWLFNKNTVEKVIETLMSQGHKVEGGDKLGKTIIFAKNDKHAEFIVEVFNKMFPQLGGEFCQKITNKVNYAQDLIDRFSIVTKFPQIAVSVDMLDTGIDVPEVLNLVFFKKIRSKSKFWQMIGRGTRLCPNIFSPEIDKKNFYIFDFCKNFTFFESNQKEIEGCVPESLTQKIFNSRVNLTYFLQDIKYQEIKEYKEFWNNLLNTIHNDILEIDISSAFARKEVRYIEKYKDKDELTNLNEIKINELKNNISYIVYSKDLDEKAKRFDLLIMKLQLSILDEGKVIPSAIKGLRELGKGLEKLGSIPKVLEKKEVVKLLNNDEFWEDIDIIALEKIRNDLRDLIKYLDGDNSSQKIIYTDFSDEIIKTETKGISFGVYDFLPTRDRVRKIMLENKEKASLIKLKNNIVLDDIDIKELNDILFGNKIVTVDEVYEEVKKENEVKQNKDITLGLFLRSIIGLDGKAVEEQFCELISGKGFSGVQIELIDYIIKHYVKNGVFYKKQLRDPDIKNFYGAEFFSIFPNMEDAKSLVDIIDSINGTANFRIN